MSDRDYYSLDYSEARARFLKAAHNLQLQMQSVQRNCLVQHFPVPSQTDKDLFVDSISVPAQREANTLLILTSGVHGVESFVGSAIQLMFLSELRARLPSDRCGLLMFHVLNPYGFKHGRRSTENNVNLNRNFAADESLFATPNLGYDRLAKRLEPKHQVRGRLRGLFQSAAFIARALVRDGFTAQELNEAMSQGQFQYPTGLEYGGRTWEPQIRHFIDVLKPVIQPYKNVLLFDLHTGLGDRFQLHLIPSMSKETRNPELFAKHFDVEKDRDFCAYTPAETPGFYHTHGDLISLLPAIAPSGQRTLGLTFEYGTNGTGLLGKLQVLNRSWLENTGFHKGYLNSRVKAKLARDYLEQFYPSDIRWRENAVARARRVLSRVVDKI